MALQNILLIFYYIILFKFNTIFELFMFEFPLQEDQLAFSYIYDTRCNF
jgi:hypothetical protein